MAQTILTPFQKTFLLLISQNKKLALKFYLSGGTALAEFYLQHRFSEDLDFFSPDEFNLVPIQAFLKQVAVKLNLSKIEYRNFMGIQTFFLHQEQNILKVDFNFYPFPRIEKGQKFALLEIDSLRDIAVNKVQTIATQPRSRDFIDLYYIIQKTGWTIEGLSKDARVKFDHFVDPFHLGSQFLKAKELKDYPRLVTKIDENKWQEFFVNEAKKLGKQVLK